MTAKRDWNRLDWEALDRLRALFLGNETTTEPYWTSDSDLASYDLTFGERIGWKWDAVLEELQTRGWAPPGGSIVDWGCGSGIAARRVIRRFGAKSFEHLTVIDHSPLAAEFARNAAASEFPDLPISVATAGFVEGAEPIGLLVVSHVLGELDEAGTLQLAALAARSKALLWTEPGSREISRRLGDFRERWLGSFGVVAPCTHACACPILEPGNDRHWCHHFAPPPPFVFTDSDWVRFGRRAGVDLRSLPYAFLALSRGWQSGPAGCSRIIGRPEDFKPYVRLLDCSHAGLTELSVSKRTNKALCRELEHSRKPLVYCWSREGAAIKGGAALA